MFFFCLGSFNCFYAASFIYILYLNMAINKQNSLQPAWPTLHEWTCCKEAIPRPANLENVFRGTFRVKKRDLPAKSGTVGRAHIEIFFEVFSLQKSIAFQNTL